MNKRSLMVLLCALASLILVACARTEPAANHSNGNSAASEKKPTQAINPDKYSATYDGVKLSVVSITRAKEREILPGFSTGEKMAAKKGFEFAMLQLKVTSLEPGKKLDVKRLEVQDDKGKSFGCVFEITDLCDPRRGNEVDCELPFGVNEGAVLTKLKFGDAVIDITELGKK